jgi:hypothetical protein
MTKYPAMKLTTLLSKTVFVFIVLLAAKVNAQSELLWSVNQTVEMPGTYADKPAITYNENTETLKVTGRKNTPDGQRLSIVNYSLEGNIESEQIIGSDLVTNNKIFDYKIDNEQNIYILHHETVNVNLYKTILQKYSAEGTLIWAKEIEDELYSYSPTSITLNNSGSRIFLTVTKEIRDFDVSEVISQNLYIYDTEGNLTGENTFDQNTELSMLFPKGLSSDGSVYLFGKDYNNYQYFKALKINDDSSITANIIITQPVVLNHTQFTQDNNLLMFTNNNVLKFTPQGELLWSGPASATTYYEIRQVIQDSEGNIYVTGRYFGTQPDTNNDILTTKYDSTGNVIWQNIYKYGAQNADIGNTLMLKNGYVYVGGKSEREGISSDYDYILLQLNAESGSLNGLYRYNGAENGNDEISSIYVFDNDNVAITGLSYLNSGYNQTTQLLSGVPLGAQEVTYGQNITVWPNPAENGNLLTLKGTDLKHYKIFSTTGQIVFEDNFDTSEIYSIPTAGLSSGMYFLTVESENGRHTQKILIQ